MKIEVINIHGGMSVATLTAYIQESDNTSISGNRPAVIICPGGAYIGYTEKEAEPVALRFLSEGYNAFILRYSIGAGLASFPAPFIDAAKAVMLVRINAMNWGVDRDKIVLCGFSTGGQVAAILGATWQEEYLTKALNADNHLFKPNALLLGYPMLDLHRFKNKNTANSSVQLIKDMMFTAVFGSVNPDKQQSDEWNCINRITAGMPRTFIWLTSEDEVVEAEQSLNFIKALAAKKIPYEFHIFEKGAHGLSLGDISAEYMDPHTKKNVNAHKWVELAINWLNLLNSILSFFFCFLTFFRDIKLS